jgi:predicted phosphodiesterase
MMTVSSVEVNSVMRIALLSDIHGNTIALDAVLQDIQKRGGVDACWVLGDLAAIGYDPVGVLERLAELPNASFVRGNTDRFVVTGEPPMPTLEQLQSDRSLVPKMLEMVSSFAWTQGAVTTSGWLLWLAALPTECRLMLPDGTRLLGVHAAPGCDDGDGVHPGLNKQELQVLLGGCDADLVCVGHTHWPLDIRVGGVRVVNVGSISNPLPPDLRACYVLLEANRSGYQLQHRRVDYNHEAVIVEVRRANHPASNYIISFMRGWNIPRWQKS